MPAKKSKKHRKHGRNKKHSDRQRLRTTRNKARRLLKEELKAGRELPWPNVHQDVMIALTILRNKQ
jgi:hypothetical protein